MLLYGIGRKPNAIPPLLGEGKGDCQQLEGLRLFYDSSLEYAQKFSNILKLETWQGVSEHSLACDESYQKILYAPTLLSVISCLSFESSHEIPENLR